MTAHNPLHNQSQETTRGHGNFGVRFTRFVNSGGPGGYSTVELVYLFPTPTERYAHASKLRRERKGSRRTGPVIETFEVDIAELRWFENPYQRSVVIDAPSEHLYGIVRIYDTNAPVYDVQYAQDEEELRWMLAAQWATEDWNSTPSPGQLHAPYDVLFFATDEAPRLRIVIEQVDSDDESEEGA